MDWGGGTDDDMDVSPLGKVVMSIFFAGMVAALLCGAIQLLTS